MSPDQQPIKLLGTLVDSNYRVIPPSSGGSPSGTNVSYVNDPNAARAISSLDADYISVSKAPYTAAFETYISSFNQNGPQVPSDVDNFVSGFVNYLVSQGLVANTDAAKNTAVKSILTQFLVAAEANLGISASGNEGSDLQLIYPSIATFGLGNIDDPNQSALLTSLWKGFIDNYPYQSNGALSNTIPLKGQGFFQNYRAFTAVTATVSFGYTVTLNGTGTSTNVVTSSSTPSFEKTFSQYFPNANNALFQQTLKDFGNAMIQKYGYFSASRQYVDFVNYVQNLSGIQAAVTARLPTQDVTILNDVLFLIIKMIGSIQNVAASQADRLSLYTSWQRGYTDLLNQVHVFTGSSQDKLKDFTSGNPFSDNPSLTDVQKRRQDEQGNFNAGMVQQITAYKDSVSEDAKALQSRVNQSSDAFNDQANTATAILQEFSTILSAIFR